jgi:alpha-N-arabinofuranosidase
LPEQPRRTLPFSGDLAYVDEFTEATLSDQWIGIRTPAKPFYALADGQLILTSGGQLGDLKNTPAFVARRQQHHIATTSTTLSFHPNRDGDRAGLVAYQSDASYLFYGLTRIGGKNVVALYTRAKAAEDVLVASTPVSGDTITLTMYADGGRMTFSYAVDGATNTLANNVDVTFLSTRKAGGFTGTIIGPYVWQSKASN